MSQPTDMHTGEPDLGSLYHAVLREREEPSEGSEPVPLWMIVGFVALIGWGGWYLGRHDAQFDPSVADMRGPVATATAGGAADEEEGPDLAAIGAQVYASRCAACHQATGQGMPNVAPRLAGSDWVSGDPKRLIRVVMHGLQGPIVVSGEPFVGVMPPWGPSLSDEEIAGVLTYVRSAWENAASPVTVEAVAEIRSADASRSTPWTAEEL